MPSPLIPSVPLPVPRYFRSLPEKIVQCDLCPRHCHITDGAYGRCGVRGNRAGNGIITYYGYITALAVDPIEKKPLYHYRPGSSILSLGFAGCNLHCPFCQNWHISQNTAVPGQYFSPEAVIKTAQAKHASRIAYTYSEPLIHAEFLLDCMALARQNGIANILVSNGCISLEGAEHILQHTDAANIDLKCFSEDTYSRILGGDLSTVRAFIKKAWEMGVHLEITTLVVPGLNDSEREIDACVDFLASLSPDIPWHLSAYHPAYTWNAPPTDPARLVSLARRANKTLSYVYTGNISEALSNTYCPQCGSLLVQRTGYRINTAGLRLQGTEDKHEYTCVYCGSAAPIRY